MTALVIVDVETDGLDAEACHTIELGCVLYSIENRRAIGQFSTLIRHTSNAAESINRIPLAAIAAAPCAQYAWNALGGLVDLAECLVLDHGHKRALFAAHRADFDRSFVAKGAPRLAARLPWMCTKHDVPWPLSTPGDHLVNLALAHGVPVHKNHEALTDCRLLVDAFVRVAEIGHDVEAMIDRALLPKALFAVADTSFDEARNAQAKALGFRWNPTSRRWERWMAMDDVAGLPFEVREVAA